MAKSKQKIVNSEEKKPTGRALVIPSMQGDSPHAAAAAALKEVWSNEIENLKRAHFATVDAALDRIASTTVESLIRRGLPEHQKAEVLEFVQLLLKTDQGLVEEVRELLSIAE